MISEEQKAELEKVALKKNRLEWSNRLRDAEWWTKKARESARRGDYAQSRRDVHMACYLLDDACQRITETSR